MATAVTTGGSAHAARDARRRRILERGSDRLALITGQIQSLPPDSETYQSPDSTCPPEQILAPDPASKPLLPNEETGSECAAPDELPVEPSPHTSQNGRNISSVSSSEISSSTQKPVQDHQRSLLNAGEIRSAIAASENARMFCSVAAAVLVITSYMGFPVARFMFLRPVYLLLLTNITIVLGRAILGARGVDSKTGSRRAVRGDALADQLGKALEIGLLMQKIVGAMFMDFSIYAVVLVSGLSLVRRLGW